MQEDNVHNGVYFVALKSHYPLVGPPFSKSTAGVNVGLDQLRMLLLGFGLEIIIGT